MTVSFLQKRQDVALAAASGLAALAVGAANGAPVLLLVGLVALGLAAWWIARKHDWLPRAAEWSDDHTLRPYAVTISFATFAILYVGLTGGPHSPLLAVLYLPVVLAVFYYRIGLGLAASVAVAAYYSLASWDDTSRVSPSSAALGVALSGTALSFPVAGLFAGLLSQAWRDKVQSLQEKAGEMTALLDMSQMMDSAQDMDTTLNLILLNVQRLSGCQVCAVYLKDASGDHLELRAASGPRNRVALVSLLEIADARCDGWTLAEAAHRQTGVEAFYLDAVTRLRPAQIGSRLLDLDRQAGSFACVPLTGGEGMLGMLYVGYDKAEALRPDDVSRLEKLAMRAGFSLQRSVSQHGYRSLAFSDAMTGLDNFRQFEATLDEEMRRAGRYGRPLSVLLLDIDHFKKFNDTLGHQAGDALLAQLATVLRDSLRSVDRPARYGGEEFVVVCPETGTDEARLIAERIRHNVEAAVFALPGKDATHVTVSVGFATFPSDAAAGHDLVKRADEALYASKAAGRNAVRGHTDLRPRVAA